MKSNDRIQAARRGAVQAAFRTVPILGVTLACAPQVAAGQTGPDTNAIRVHPSARVMNELFPLMGERR